MTYKVSSGTLTLCSLTHAGFQILLLHYPLLAATTFSTGFNILNSIFYSVNVEKKHVCNYAWNDNTIDLNGVFVRGWLTSLAVEVMSCPGTHECRH